MRNLGDVAGIKPDITGVFTLADGTIINLNNADFVGGSFVLKNGTSNSGTLEVGGCVIGGCNFSLVNDDSNNRKFDGVDWYDSEVSLTLWLGNVEVNIGDFLVVTHKETGNLVSFDTYDRLKLLDEYGLYEDHISFPATIQTIISTICTNRGLTYSGIAFPNMQVSDPGDDTMTERQCVSFLAQIMGQFAYVKDNVLTFGWYDTQAYSVGTSFSHNLNTQDFSVTGLKVKAKDDSTVSTRGTGNTIEIANNPFINSTNIETVTTQIWNAVKDIEYRGGSCDIKSNLNVEAGDIVNVTTGQGTYTMIVSSVTYKPQLTESIESSAPEISDLRLSKTEQIKKLADDTINNQLDNPNSDLYGKVGDVATSAVCDGLGDSTSDIYGGVEDVARDTISDELQDSSSDLAQAIAGAGGGADTGDYWECKQAVGYRHYKIPTQSTEADNKKRNRMLSIIPKGADYNSPIYDWSYYDQVDAVWKNVKNNPDYSDEIIFGDNNFGTNQNPAHKEINPIINRFFGQSIFASWITADNAVYPGFIFQRPPAQSVGNHPTEVQRDAQPSAWRDDTKIPHMCIYFDCRTEAVTSTNWDLAEMPARYDGSQTSIKLVVAWCSARGVVASNTPRFVTTLFKQT